MEGGRTGRHEQDQGIEWGRQLVWWAVMQGGEPVVIPTGRLARTNNRRWWRITKDGTTRLVGQGARKKRQAVTNPRNQVYRSRGLMGGASEGKNTEE